MQFLMSAVGGQGSGSGFRVFRVQGSGFREQELTSDLSSEEAAEVRRFV
jgi:hypothetical protein